MRLRTRAKRRSWVTRFCPDVPGTSRGVHKTLKDGEKQSCCGRRDHWTRMVWESLDGSPFKLDRVGNISVSREGEREREKVSE